MNDWQLASGYRFSGVHSGIRSDPNRLDLALVVSDRPASAASVFTQNRVAAAPVQVCRERLPRTTARGIVICSGNANACTGQQGLDDARTMARTAADCFGCPSQDLLVCSTGVIGRLLPMDVIVPGIKHAYQALDEGPAAFERAARAILTTDTVIKVATRAATVAGQTVRVTGFAKGAAMIGPNMATMLAFVLSDAAVDVDDLQSIVRDAAAQSFNCISVEGHTSTNDTLLLFANGTGKPLSGAGLADYRDAVIGVCRELAQAIARDAEGASHFVTLNVTGLRNDGEARQIAKAVAESALVKTAIFGADPNWGRIVSAAGYAGVPFEEQDLSLRMGDFILYARGTPQPFDAARASAYLKDTRDITIDLLFELGPGRCTFWTCDLTYEYVRLNADYTT